MRPCNRTPCGRVGGADASAPGDHQRRSYPWRAVPCDFSRIVLGSPSGHVPVERLAGPLLRRGISTGRRRSRRCNETKTTPPNMHRGPLGPDRGGRSSRGPSPIPVHGRGGTRGAPSGLPPPHPPGIRGGPRRTTGPGRPLRIALMIPGRQTPTPGKVLPGRSSS